jgi:hypothetical protein
LDTPVLDSELKNPSIPQAASNHFLFPYFLLVFGGLLVLGVALLPRYSFFFDQVGYWSSYPFFRGGSEGLILSEAAIIRSGGSIYMPFRPDSFISAPYPPLYYYLLSWFWGAEGTPGEGFATGRLLSLVSAVVSSFAILALVMGDVLRRTPQRTRLIWLWAFLAGSVGGIIFLTLPAVNIWAMRVRADMLMTAFGLVGLAMVALNPRGWLGFAAILPLTLALFTKHTALAAPAAAFAYLIFQNWGNWKRIALWFASLCVAVLVPFFIINTLSDNQFYLRLFDYHALPFLNTNLVTYLNLFLSENLALLVAGGGLLIWVAVAALAKFKVESGFWAKIGVSLAQVPLALWYLLASLPLLVGLGVSGADHNHFLPSEAATCTAAGVLFGFTLTKATAKDWSGWLALPVLAVLIWQVAVCSVPNSRYEIEFRRTKPDELRQLQAIARSIADNPFPILTSEAAWFVLANKDQSTLIYNDLFTLTALAKKGLYDINGLYEAIRQKKFGLIVAKDNILNGPARSDVWTTELVTLLRENYKLKFSDVWFQFEPK